MSKKKIIIGNWKMNPSSLDEAKRIFAKTRAASNKFSIVEVVACPPAVYISNFFKKIGENMSLGSQDVSYEEGGSHTGEISVSMLKDLDVNYVIVGHSERRAKGEDEISIKRKIKMVLDVGMKAVVCFGEKERDENGLYLDNLKDQMKKVLEGLDTNHPENIIIVYEPIWAIGASEAMRPDDIYETSIFLRKVFSDIFGQELSMKIKILYGGAVNSRNAYDILSVGKVDGFLVGRESVNIAGFTELIKVVGEFGLSHNNS